VTARSIAAFAASLPARGVLMGLDLGSRTIGVAFCDAEWRFASPAATVTRRKQASDFSELRRLAGERRLAGIVLGYPINMDGSSGPRAQATRAFARALDAEFGLPVLLHDERLSTHAVEETLITTGVSRSRREARIDALAAAHILQGAIDALAELGARG
jgi:putative Holliday junction resolvase